MKGYFSSFPAWIEAISFIFNRGSFLDHHQKKKKGPWMKPNFKMSLKEKRN